jgi:hypothetical protein
VTINHIAFLKQTHAVLRPQTYLEIGVNQGESCELAQCSSIGIDPEFRIATNIVGNKHACFLYQMGSDAFFEKFNPRQILGRAIDLAFLDGMHLYEFLLRDFINTEKSCKQTSMILMHDCVPTDIYMPRRSQTDPDIQRLAPTPEAWSGDVWKVIPILKKYRPELRIHVFDPSPTGIVCVTNLDPTSNTLEENYLRIIDEFQGVQFADAQALAEFRETLGILPGGKFNSVAAFSTITFF